MFLNNKYKCTERVSVHNLNRMISHLEKTPNLQQDEKKYNEFQLLKKIKKRAGRDGSYDVNFSLKDCDTANTRALGRLYPAGTVSLFSLSHFILNLFWTESKLLTRILFIACKNMRWLEPPSTLTAGDYV